MTREVWYFELGILTFNLYVYYLTRVFIASICAFNFPTRAFNLAARAFSFLTRAFELVTRRFELVTCISAPLTHALLFHDCLVNYIEGTLMQIWKSHYIFAFKLKQYPQNSAFLILRFLELFAHKVCKFLKK